MPINLICSTQKKDFFNFLSPAPSPSPSGVPCPCPCPFLVAVSLPVFGPVCGVILINFNSRDRKMSRPGRADKRTNKQDPIAPCSDDAATVCGNFASFSHRFSVDLLALWRLSTWHRSGTGSRKCHALLFAVTCPLSVLRSPFSADRSLSAVHCPRSLSAARCLLSYALCAPSLAAPAPATPPTWHIN